MTSIESSKTTVRGDNVTRTDVMLTDTDADQTETMHVRRTSQCSVDQVADTSSRRESKAADCSNPILGPFGSVVSKTVRVCDQQW